MSNVKRLNPAIALLLAVVLSACGVATILTILDAGLQILSQVNNYVGVIPPVAMQFFVSASDCIAFASTEYSSADSPSDKLTKVEAQCGAIVKANLTGFPPGLVDLATNLIVKITSIIEHFQQGATVAAAHPRARLPVISVEDRNRLADVAQKARTEKAKLLARKQ